MVAEDVEITVKDMFHPDYSLMESKWEKWRLTYKAGDDFIEKYTQTFSKREDSGDFVTRKRITYCPAFAKAAVNDIKNAIFQRMIDISRKGGTSTYQEAITGKDAGVDLCGSSMNSFIGRKILPELLTMAKVGIYVDMPIIEDDATIRDIQGKRPYIYLYQAESIQSWSLNSVKEFDSLLLVDFTYDINVDFYLPTTLIQRYRYYRLVDEGVIVQFFNSEGEFIGEKLLNIPKIPFVVLGLNDSLLSDASNYQIALLNLGSSDMSYALKSNFPFYTEQYDPRVPSPNLRPVGKDSTEANTAKVEEVRVGVAAGRRYPLGTDRPSFIHPSSEPLRASMDKQESLKRDIRLLVNLAVTNIDPKMASAESKSLDNQGLESGLSYIGMELEHAERKIAEFWSMYENSREIATVSYPERYSLKSDDERRKEAQDLGKSFFNVPSLTYQKEVSKQIANLLLGPKVSNEVLNTIFSEIDDSKIIVTDPEILIHDLENGLVSVETVSKLRNYPKGEVEQAKKDHADRLSRIAIAQSEGEAKARGVGDLGGSQGSADTEKQGSQSGS